jgi:hypothetical protein
MRPLLIIVGFFGMVFVGGSLVAPWLYAAVQWGAGHWQGLEKMAGMPFHRFVNRSFLLVALLGLPPFLRAIGIRTWLDAGLPRPHGKRLGWGFLIGWISLATIACLSVGFGMRTWNFASTPAHYAGHLFSTAATAVVVGVLEEALFRGALYGSLRKSMPWPAAVVSSSLIFAILHFFQRTELSTPVDWFSGLKLLPRMLQGFSDWDALVPGFFTLAVLGTVLAIAYERTGNLYFSIGLHAGLIFWLKTYGFVTQETSPGGSSFWGTNKLTDGWISLLCRSLSLRHLSHCTTVVSLGHRPSQPQ